MKDRHEEQEAMIREIRSVWLDSLGLDASGGGFQGVDELREAVAMDSVAMIEFVVAIEKNFGIAIEEEWLDMERLADLPALADYIRRRSESSRPPGAFQAGSGAG